ncbi:MAG: response regulator [Pedobacter sp.]|nr:MAG: response regulator [Pedobacter sp.]
MKKILIIDDDPVNTHVLKWMLKSREYKVISFASHKGIQDLLHQLSPDLLIMDISLDGANGCEICLGLKTGDSHSSLPILMTSANRDYYDTECLADGFIPKPYDKLALLQAVEAII